MVHFMIGANFFFVHERTMETSVRYRYGTLTLNLTEFYSVRTLPGTLRSQT